MDETEEEIANQLNELQTLMASKSIFNYLKTKTIGNAWSFMSEQSDLELPSTTEEVINHVYSILKKEFVGFDAPEAEADLMNTNIHRIFNLRICDMCYVEPFICEFSKYYYAISPQKRLQYNLLGLFYNKLPSFFFLNKEHQLISLKKKRKYNKEKRDKTKTFSKGGKPIVGHSQPIPNVLSPNKLRDNIKPKNVKRGQR